MSKMPQSSPPHEFLRYIAASLKEAKLWDTVEVNMHIFKRLNAIADELLIEKRDTEWREYTTKLMRNIDEKLSKLTNEEIKKYNEGLY